MYNENKICATIEARMGSSRLPGKVMLDLVGKPVLQHIIERLRRSEYIDEVVVATTKNKSDDIIVDLCKEVNCKYYRGSEENVLLRVLETAKSVDADIIVEITGDCPMIDWRHVDYLIEKFFSGEYDYVSNIIKRTFPIGFDTQVFPVAVLEEVNRITDSAVDHEHVSLYIYSHPDRYELLNWKAPEELNYPNLEITLDTAQDYKLIKRVYQELYHKNKDFDAYDIVDFLLENEDVRKIVEEVSRKNPFKEKEIEASENEEI